MSLREEMRALREQLDAAESIKFALERCGVGLRNCDKAREAVMSDIGDLLRQARRLAADAGWAVSQPDITRSAVLTGLSRPTMYKLLADEPTDGGGDPRRYGNRELARMHAGYGYGGHESIDAEFWRRFPHLAGWYNCMTRLFDLGDPEEMYRLPPEIDAVYATLRDDYHASVDAIAHERYWPPE